VLEFAEPVEPLAPFAPVRFRDFIFVEEPLEFVEYPLVFAPDVLFVEFVPLVPAVPV